MAETEIDVFDEAPAIVDCDVLEAAKENIQPLAKGRRVTALAGILSTPHAQRESRLAAARNRLRINVEVALEGDDEDALEAYCCFVNWTLENYPQGHSAESGLLELLEEATRMLKDDREGRWRADIRYLKLWVLYAGYVEKPAVIYKFCLVNEIATSHSLLYEEYATVLERASRRAEADEVYLLGIARKASPLDRLENKHREFQRRMMASINLSPPIAESSASSSSAHRPALAEAASSSSTPTRSGPTRAPPSEDVLSSASGSAPAVRSNGRIPVFVDPAGDAENDPEQASPWPELGTRKGRIKENIPEVRKAQGTTLRQPRAVRPARAASGSSRIVVYRDPEPGAQEMPPMPSGKKEKAKSSMTVFRDGDEGNGSGSTGPGSAGKGKGKGAVSVFRDEDAREGSNSLHATSTKREKGKSSIPVFRDEDTGKGSSPPSVPAGKKPDKAKSSSSVSRDDGAQEKQETPVVLSTPTFMPYRDEPGTFDPSTAPASIMKPKASRKDVLGLTEAEALRRDPLKNYAFEERPTED